MQKKLIIFVFFSILKLQASSQDREEAALIKTLKRHYEQCQTHWNATHAFKGEREKLDQLIAQGLSYEADKMNARAALDDFRIRQLEKENEKLRSEIILLKPKTNN